MKEFLRVVACQSSKGTQGSHRPLAIQKGRRKVQGAKSYASGHSAVNKVIKLAMKLISCKADTWAHWRAEVEAVLEVDYGNACFLYGL